MKIGINARDCLGAHRGGIGRYAVNLIESMGEIIKKRPKGVSPHISVIVSEEDERRSPRVRRLVAERDKVIATRRRFTNRLSKVFFDHFISAEWSDRNDIEIFHGLKYVLPAVRKLSRAAKSVVTVHDLIFLEKPELYPFLSRKYWKLSVKKSVDIADRVLTPSEFTRMQVGRHYGRDAYDKCKVIYHGVDPIFLGGSSRDRDKSDNGDYFLCVGTLEPRKNLWNTVRGFERYLAIASEEDPRLIWIGKNGWEKKRVFDHIRSRGLADRIDLLGYGSDRELLKLYGGAKALLYLSLGEGFGLPVLEAMASGCPVIHSGKGALAEVVGGGQLMVDPREPEAIARAMKKVAVDDEGRRRMIREGYKRAIRFKWRRAAEATLETYEELL